MKNTKGFTLIELLVVIAIIGILASVVMASLNSARSKASDARLKRDLQELSKAVELYHSTNGSYPGTAGWFDNTDYGGLGAALIPTYIGAIDSALLGNVAQYWRKDYGLCSYPSDPNRYGFYVRLTNPTAADTATLTDAFDLCVQTNWGMNYKIGN